MKINRMFASLCSGFVLAGLATGGAQAGFFDFLGGGSKQPQPTPPPVQLQQPPRPVAPPVMTVPRARGYCVRTCDGYYFSTGFITTQRDQDVQASMCESSCQGAQMVFYKSTADNNGSNGNTKPAIESATDPGGSPYSVLPTAYAFRNGDNPSCSCAATPRGLPQIPLTQDPTLRSGDIVVMPGGLKVFRGAPNTPHQDKDFSAVASSKNLPDVVRQEIQAPQGELVPENSGN